MVAVARSDPNVVWGGPAEQLRNSVSSGDGVYKSVDGGRTWKNMGLGKRSRSAASRSIAGTPNIVYVSALAASMVPTKSVASTKQPTAEDLEARTLRR